MNWLDIVGDTVGRLTVTSLHSIKKDKKNKNKARYICVCVCGKEVVVGRDELRFGRTRSCGCLRTDSMRKAGKDKVAKQKKVTCPSCTLLFSVPKCREDVAKYCSVVCANEGLKKENKTPDKHNGWEYKEWRKRVINRDESICIKCGEYCDKPVAHHLISFAKHREERYNVDNGITMCNFCHNEFHNTYSRNTFTQIEFIRWLRWTS